MLERRELLVMNWMTWMMLKKRKKGEVCKVSTATS